MCSEWKSADTNVHSTAAATVQRSPQGFSSKLSQVDICMYQSYYSFFLNITNIKYKYIKYVYIASWLFFFLVHSTAVNPTWTVLTNLFTKIQSRFGSPLPFTFLYVATLFFFWGNFLFNNTVLMVRSLSHGWRCAALKISIDARLTNVKIPRSLNQKCWVVSNIQMLKSKEKILLNSQGWWLCGFLTSNVESLM